MRTRGLRILAAVACLVALIVGAIAWTTVLAGRLLQTFAASFLEPLLDGLVAAIYWMMVQECVVAGIVWITRGPIWTLAWIGSRIMIWQGH